MTRPPIRETSKLSAAIAIRVPQFARPADHRLDVEGDPSEGKQRDDLKHAQIAPVLPGDDFPRADGGEAE